MANSEHLSILKQGVETWNDWRRQFSIKRVDLSETNLTGMNLIGANLSEANLSKADLSKADLSEARINDANLRKAVLNGANLRYAGLMQTDLSEAQLGKAQLNDAYLNEAILDMANLRWANLHDAKLIKAKLRGADLSWAHLDEANLQGADLFRANLYRADFGTAHLAETMLIEANLSQSNLEYANLSRAILRKANLSSTILSNAGLVETDLSEANLSRADLRNARLKNVDLNKSNLAGADLREAQFENVNLTGSNLWGTARFNWKIENIICDYIYFDQLGAIRNPKKRNFEPGEFEKLHQSVPLVEIVFEKGMNFLDPAILAFIAEESKESRPELQLALRTIEFSGIHPMAVFEIAAERLKDEAELIVTKRHREISANPEYINSLLQSLETLTKTNQKLIEMIPNKREINTGGGNYYEGSTHAESITGNKIIAQNIKKVSYHEGLGVSETEFQELKDAIMQLHHDKLVELQKIYEHSNDKENG